MIPLTVILLASLSPLLAILLILLGVVVVRQRRRIGRLLVEARHDPLTGLPNRRGLEVHWSGAQEEMSLILIDLVGFKAVNDSHGHIVGDTLLKQVAQRLAAAVPPPGLIARWGGDEFAAAVPRDCTDKQMALFDNALTMAFDLSEGGGPAHVRIGARTGISDGESQLPSAVRSAARGLLEAKAER
ncbi:GGDEF domain-containing protein [Sandaracinobacter sp. RS1-74]|uniref:GGDEF domain-containing protein n=1 Tax=Sandaracinobacteroides sayramensis TaxID=2913411 RepID=UPI001EDBD4A4|nr:GGDEF domain-containing protein [Sandaracinobacteroides sayramensis]MCG2841638.1 GGDEF domain-containing protein [Sandaracinobacteroides sayramensis]